MGVAKRIPRWASMNTSRRNTMQEHSKSDLSRPRAALIELMQRINFGTIELLPIRHGEPVLDPPPALSVI